MPLYIVDTNVMTADGPYSNRDAVVEEFEARADESDELYLIEVHGDGRMTVAEIHDWLEEEREAEEAEA